MPLIRAMYIHIPFCTHICHYCDFNKVFLKGQPVDQYLEALRKEIAIVFREHPPAALETVYIGGGTPTALSEKQLDRLMDIIHSFVDAGKLKEFTVEANPGDLTGEKLAILKAAGVNRLSIGAQSFNDSLLERIGRTHRAKDVYEAVEQARKRGFENINIDLMYALPGQTASDVLRSLDHLFRLDVPHCSAYSLIVEPKTVFYNLLRKGMLALPAEDEEADMYERIMEEMEKRGLHQYEISNFAKKGFESMHNRIYWDNENYYGFGAGAHSYIGDRRIANIGPVKKYIEKLEAGQLPVREEQRLSLRERVEEEMFLGLRKTEGVSVAKFEKKFGFSPFAWYGERIRRLEEENLLVAEGGKIRLTKKGKLLGNVVFSQFLVGG
ncbi:putative coproporphyrinogen III oxidase [Caldibacillus debilis]|uniref:Heme chaperone HemW n=1 Tax=Caldibacillus debilis TaxID=301148 RepID=A0A150LFV8_9BACI|nr:radical SAM family heme chaperone HemW [Caldibacillus debilis]KYD11120.1 putative coproporphyrinogen III oxidase [Caldibacillus debilis]